MNNEQRRIVRTWIALAAIFVMVIALDVSGHGSWIRPVLLLLILPMLGIDRPDSEGSARWTRVANDHPFLKWWLGTCAVLIMVNAFIAMHSSVRVLDALGFSGVIVLVAFVLGPLFAFVEYDKYKEAADDDA